jgi:hypothetical protein
MLTHTQPAVHKLCFTEYKAQFEPSGLAKTLGTLLDLDPLPTLFMRTVRQLAYIGLFVNSLTVPEFL